MTSNLFSTAPDRSIADLESAVATLNNLTPDQIPLLRPFIQHWHDVLFKSYPGWFIPILNQPGNNELLSVAEYIIRLVSYHDKQRSPIFQLCLFFQSSFNPHITDQALNHQRVLAQQFFQWTEGDALYHAITHYLHPKQAEECALLQSKFPMHPSFAPLHNQYDIPPEARPLLFPDVDTTIISPQFDWFIYLLSKYSYLPGSLAGELNSIVEGAACDPTSPTLLKPDFSISDTFVHTHMFNSFDEFLSAKLPEVTAQLNLPDRDPPTTHPILFSYFDKPHPCFSNKFALPHRSFMGRTEVQFETHFIFSFLFGLSLFTQHPPDFYHSLDYTRYLSQFRNCLIQTDYDAPSFNMLLQSYSYRLHLLTTDIQHLTTHLNTINSTPPSQLHPQPQSQQPQQPLRTTPPRFTRPCFPIFLTFLNLTKFWQTDTPIADTLKDDFILSKNFAFRLSNAHPRLFPLLLHLFHNDRIDIDPYHRHADLNAANTTTNSIDSNNNSPHPPPPLLHIQSHPNPIDFYILDFFMTPSILTALTTQSALETENQPLRLSLAALSSCFIVRSYERYLQGQPTWYQYLYHLMNTQPDVASSLEKPNTLHSLLTYPFFHYCSSKHSPQVLHKHIFLTIHAGFINFTPPHPSPTRASSNPNPSPALYQALAPIRSFFIALLVSLTDTITFFPPTQRLQANKITQLIPLVTNLRDLAFLPGIWVYPFNIAFRPNRAIQNVISGPFPDVESLTYDDLGHIHTITYHNDNNNNNNHTNIKNNNKNNNNSPVCKHLRDPLAYVFRDRTVEDGVNTQTNPLTPSLFSPTILPELQTRISSTQTIVALRSPQAIRVQNHLIKHFKAATISDTQRVQAKLQHVLLTSDALGLLGNHPAHQQTTPTPTLLTPTTPSPLFDSTPDPPIATCAQALTTILARLPFPISWFFTPPPPNKAPPPPKAYPLPTPNPLPSASSDEYNVQIVDWALELLIICLLGVHPPQPLHQPQTKTRPSMIDQPHPSTSTQQPATATTNPFHDPATSPHLVERGKTVLLSRLNQTILALLHTDSGAHPWSVQSDFYDTMISSTLAPMLSIFDTLAALPSQPIPSTVSTHP